MPDNVLDTQPIKKPNIPKDATVLVVEDNIVNLKTISMVLEKLRITVSIAVNGIEALATMQQDSFDIVFMDIEMPVMDGIETTSKIRSGTIEGINTNTTIIALTAYAMEGDSQKFIDAGMDYYLSKPINTQSLRSILSRYSLGGTD